MELVDMLKDLKGNMNYNKERNGIIEKRNQEIKWNFRVVSTISKIKYSLDKFNSRLETAGKNTNELEVISVIVYN